MRCCLLLLALASCAPARDAARDSATVSASDSAAPARAATDTGAWTVRPDGYGPVRVGMSLADASDALGEQLSASFSDFEVCDYVHPHRFPAGVSLMVLRDSVGAPESIERIDVESSGVATAEGARVGDSEASVQKRYAGRVTVQPAKYAGPEGKYLVVTPADSATRIVFETLNGRVASYRAGNSEAAQLVEGCA
jgi:hypothetical protein